MTIDFVFSKIEERAAFVCLSNHILSESSQKNNPKFTSELLLYTMSTGDDSDLSGPVVKLIQSLDKMSCWIEILLDGWILN